MVSFVSYGLLMYHSLLWSLNPSYGLFFSLIASYGLLLILIFPYIFLLFLIFSYELLWSLLSLTPVVSYALFILLWCLLFLYRLLWSLKGTNFIEHEILVGDAQPIRRPPYRTPFALRGEMKA